MKVARSKSKAKAKILAKAKTPVKSKVSKTKNVLVRAVKTNNVASPDSGPEQSPAIKDRFELSFLLSDISATKVILSQYAYMKNKRKVEEFEDEDGGMSLTLVSPEEDISMADILQEKSKRSYYFLDTHKVQNKMWPNMIDVTLTGPLPASTTKSCWWDRHSFQNRPIGCPLRYIASASGAVGSTVGDSATVPTLRGGEDKKVFETEGYFCGFPCCKAYIISQKSNPKYKDSLALLTMLFMSFYNRIEYTPKAPTWKILKEYCGHLTIQEYRAAIGRLEYEETVNLKRSQLICSSQYIQEKRTKTLKKISGQN
jgi:hypothetical protein